MEGRVPGMNGAVRASGEVLRTLAAWVEAEFRPWQNRSIDRADIEDRLRDEARRNGQVCLYRIRDGRVDFAPFTAMHRPFLLDPDHSGGARAHLYLRHLREVVNAFGLSGSALIGIFVADLHLPRPRAPVFCYQKRAGDRGLLLPDVDLLSDDYCATADGRYDDPVPFEAKRPQAIFVGSTTSTTILTMDDVRRRRNPRLDAALFFREEADVIFQLPNIVQYDDEDTRAAIEQLNVHGRRWSWAEQQHFRYMLSLDGNGATCGRVAATLHGHQVLAKYASPNMLYYFHGLRPWHHYVPINEHGDVLDLVADADAGFSLHRDIAERSRQFARQFLTRVPIMHYSALMLSSYIRHFGEDRTR
jgi:hypothetical protein